MDKKPLYRTMNIYFMSGTGNSYRAASLLAEQAHLDGVDSRVVQINNARPKEEIAAGRENLLALAFPTHAFTAPWPMLRFVLRLPRRRGTHAMVMPTRAGTKFGPCFFPGMEGTAGYLLALILAFKGYDVRGVRAIDMPSNWMALHPGFAPENARAIIERGKARIEVYAKTILDGRRFYGGFISLILGLLLLQVSLGYMLMGRFFLSKLFFATEKCTGCGLCAENCAHKGVMMQGKNNPRPYWTYYCESCMRCMAYCPVQAVEAGHSLAVIFYFVAAVPWAVYIMNLFSSRLPFPGGNIQGWILLIINYFFTLFALFLTYLVFHLLISIPLVNRFFTYTTLTRIFRRYHEPETRLKDFH